MKDLILEYNPIILGRIFIKAIIVLIALCLPRSRINKLYFSLALKCGFKIEDY